jgi:hypothetical protein
VSNTSSDGAVCTVCANALYQRQLCNGMMLEREVEWCLGYLRLHLKRHNFCTGGTFWSVMLRERNMCASPVVL